MNNFVHKCNPVKGGNFIESLPQRERSYCQSMCICGCNSFSIFQLENLYSCKAQFSVCAQPLNRNERCESDLVDIKEEN